jgi:hypothetical protein
VIAVLHTHSSDGLARCAKRASEPRVQHNAHNAALTGGAQMRKALIAFLFSLARPTDIQSEMRKIRAEKYRTSKTQANRNWLKQTLRS